MTKSAREKSCDATRKGSLGITAIVRLTDTGYIARAGTASVSTKAVTIKMIERAFTYAGTKRNA